MSGANDLRTADAVVPGGDSLLSLCPSDLGPGCTAFTLAPGNSSFEDSPSRSECLALGVVLGVILCCLLFAAYLENLMRLVHRLSPREDAPDELVVVDELLQEATKR
jgi:hypothetical protein